jgi:hypothetical protein
MRRVCLLTSFLAFALLSTARDARANDPAAALAQLKEGYDRKQAGDCAAAIPYFVESVRLDPQPKALLNLTDCEMRTGALSAAMGHATLARDLARQSGNGELVSIAEARAKELDARLPRLTVRLEGLVAGAVVTRDDITLGVPSLGTPLPADPGKHVVVVRAPGHEDARFEVMLEESAHEELVAHAGPESLPNEGVVVTLASVKPSAPSPPHRQWSVVRTIAIGHLVVGAAGVALGAGFGVEAIENNNASNANGHCAGGCDATGRALRNTAISDATVSTIAVAGGLAVVAGGLALWFTAPHTEAPIGVRSVAWEHGGGIAVLGSF